MPIPSKNIRAERIIGTLDASEFNISGNLLISGNTQINGGLTANTISGVNYIDFNTTPTVPNPTGGTVYFDSNENALSYKPITNQNDVTVNLGQESLIRIYNDLPTTILNGQVLHITGATIGVPTVALANASILGATFLDSLAQSSGVATHDIPSGEYGFMTNFGIVRDLNTTAFTVGSEVFLSDTVDGALTNDPNNIAFTSRISTVGYCLESNATTGKILVVITNENQLQSLTQQEINVLLGNTISTGAYFYTGATTASTTTINVSPMRGWIVYNTGPAYATDPLVLNVYYSGGTNLPVSGLTTSFDTYLLVNSGGTLYQTNVYPSPQERRQNIFLGRVVHPNKTTILNVEQSVDYDVSPLSSLRDLWVPIKIINEGVVPSNNGANLTFKTSSGTFWGNGIGFPTNELNPNSITVPAYIPATFYYTTQSGGTFTATTTTVDTTNYDVGGVTTPVPGSGNYTTQRIYMSQSGVIRLQYGQEYYSTLAKAIAAIPSETFVVNPDNSTDCTLIGLLTVKDGTGDLSNIDDAVFTFVSKFGEILGGTGGIATTTLQQAYNNSINPEITTDSVLGGVQFKGGTGSNTDKNIIIENNSGTETAYIRADGFISGNSLNAPNLTISGGTQSIFSGNSSSDLVRITQTGSGNAFVVEDNTNPDSSPFVIDASGNTGIGVTSPTAKLQVKVNDFNVVNTGFAVSDSGNTSNYFTVNNVGQVAIRTPYTGSNNQFLIRNTNFAAAEVRFNVSDDYAFTILDNQGYGFSSSPNSISINTRSVSGNINIWTQAGNTTRLNLGGQDINPTAARTRTIISPVNSSTTAFVPTGGTAVDYSFENASNSAFQPTGGTATYTQIQLRPTYNATGTYSGTVRGLYYNPILTSLSGTTHRAIETTTGDVIFGSTSGNVGIGTSTPRQKLDVSGNTIISSGLTAQTAVFSSSSQNVLTVIGSGNSTTSPIFSVQGSSGELFSVSDSLTGSLFSVNDISGLPIVEVFSDNTTLMGSYLAPSLNTTTRTSLSAGTNTIYSIPTSAYTGAFFEYTLISTGSTGARAGQIMSIWSGTTAQFTETSTLDIGSTTGVTFNVIVSGNNALLRSSATTAGWTVKTIVRSI